MTTENPDAVADLPVDDVQPDPENTRDAAPDDGLPGLGTSMMTVGQQQAITVRPDAPGADGHQTYTVIAGHRRLAAAKLVGMKTIRAIVMTKPLTSERRHLARMAENKARKGLSPREDVDAVVKAKRENPEMTGKEVSDLTGYSEAEVSKCLAVGACSVAYAALADGRLKSLADAYAVAKALPDQKQGLINQRQMGMKSHELAAAAKPKRVRQETVKLSRVTLPLSTGTRIVISGADIDLEGLIDALTMALEAARKANKESLDVKTAEKVWRDKAKVRA